MNKLILLFAGIALVSAKNTTDDLHCSGKANGLFLRRFPKCDEYFVCMNNKSYEGKCPEPYLFNEAAQRCDWPENVDCFVCPETETELSTQPYGASCDMYILCFAGTPVLKHCADGTQFDAASGRCDLIERSECQAKLCPETNDPEHIVFLPSKIQCDKYYICLNGKATAENCGPGLFYNSNSESCDYASNVPCKVSISGRTAAGPLYRHLTHADGFICPANGVSFHAHPRSKSQYIFCSNGHSAVLTCSKDLYYNSELEECL